MRGSLSSAIMRIGMELRPNFKSLARVLCSGLEVLVSIMLLSALSRERDLPTLDDSP